MSRSFTSASAQRLEASATLPTVPFTIAGWFQVANVTSLYRLVGVDVGGSLHSLVARGDVGGDPLQVETFNGVTFGLASSTAGYTANTYFHACGVWTAANARAVFLNGANKGTNASNLPIATPTRVQVGASGGFSHMTGLGAEVAIWNVALSDAEVAQLAAGANPQAIQSGALVHYWPILGTDDPEPGCLTPTALTLVNAPPQGGSHPTVDAGACGGAFLSTPIAVHIS